ncbi:MAG TPA: TetR/AcrR family transcriptional regulator [Sphingobium sp.]|nr:TetR/AcrR family transcriptional regulator [Sphingobium sp.]
MTSSKQAKRSKGRPIAAKNGVGREALIAATRKLLQELTPAQVTIAAIGREAGVDPALIRYYFGNREALLFEVAEQIAEHEENAAPREDLTPTAQLEAFMHQTFRFTRSAKYMQRLMTEELSSAKSAEIQQKLREWQRTPVAVYEEIKARDGGEALDPFDALFLHLAVVGISDFFHSGAPVVKMLAPEGTDMAELEKRYEAFAVRLLLDGLRRRDV